MANSQTVGYRLSNHHRAKAVSIAEAEGYRSHHELARSHFIKFLDSNGEGHCVPTILQETRQDIKENQRLLIELLLTLLASDALEETSDTKIDQVLKKLSRFS